MLGWSDAGRFRAGAAADRVLEFDRPGGTLEGFPQPTASRLLRPTGLAFDADGNLYVADTGYNRVLRFDRP